MILIDKPKLKFLLAGRQITTVVLADKRVWRRGHTYAVGIHHNKTICHVEILHVERYNDGHDKLQLTIRQAQEDEIRLLGKQGGYVTHASHALPDEPEAVDELTQRRYADAGRERDRERMAERRRQQRDRIAEQLAQMRADLQDRPDKRIAKAVQAIEHQLSSIDRTIDEAA